IVVDSLDGLTDAERDTLARFLLRRVTFNLIETEDRDGASMLFRVINDRGERLNNAAMIKTELFERARLSREEAEAAAERWDGLEDDLGDDFQQLLNQIPVIVTGRVYQNPGDVGVFRRAVLDTVDPAWLLRDGLWDYVDALNELNVAN